MRNIPLDYQEPPRSFKPRKYPPIGPDMHEKIKKLYREKTGEIGAIGRFARKNGMPRWQISRYAMIHGWTSKQVEKQPPWSEPELRILKQSSHNSPEVIQKRLKKAGFTRSMVGICMKRKRMRFLQNLDGQSASQVATCLGEDIHFVMRAINTGLLKARRRELNRTDSQGGNPYLIKDGDVRAFIIENVHMIDLRKVDKYWFIDLLAGKA